MPIAAVTLDFHDTLMSCNRWFEAEVYTLAADVLGWLAERNYVVTTAAEREIALDCYRQIRRKVLRDGVERDAHSCVEEAVSILGLDVAEDVVAVGVHAVMMATLEDAAPLDGARELVRELATRGVPLAVVSSAVYHPFLEWSLARFGMLDAFSAVVTSASCGYYKSRPEIYQHALIQLGTSAGGTVHVGDSYEYDVLGAGRAGMRTVWLNHNELHVQDCAADLTVTNLRDVAGMILDRSWENP